MAGAKKAEVKPSNAKCLRQHLNSLPTTIHVSRTNTRGYESDKVRCDIIFKNRTPRQIEPNSPTPKHIGGKTFASKIVDCALFLLVSRPDVHRILGHLP